MRKPAGVIAAAVVLGVMAAFLVLMSLGTLLATALATGIASAQAAGPQPPPAMMRAIFILGATFYAGLAAWAIATLVGLLRMRNWARYSIIVIGSGLALVGLLGAAMSVLMGDVVKSQPQSLPPGQSAAGMQAVMIVMAIFALAVAAVGVWWVVYFIFRSTREAFTLATASSSSAAPPYAIEPLTFDTAQYAVEGNMPPAYLPIAAPLPSESGRPVAITVLAWLLIAGAVGCFAMAFLPIPIFFFGFVLTGWPAHLMMLAYALLSTLCGIGMFRLEKTAYFATIGYYSLGMLNCALLLFPFARHRMLAYQHDLAQRLSFGLPQQPFDDRMSELMMLPTFLFSVAICGVLLWLLYRNRAAFNRVPPASDTSAAS